MQDMFYNDTMFLALVHFTTNISIFGCPSLGFNGFIKKTVQLKIFKKYLSKVPNIIIRYGLNKNIYILLGQDPGVNIISSTANPPFVACPSMII